MVILLHVSVVLALSDIIVFFSKNQFQPHISTKIKQKKKLTVNVNACRHISWHLPMFFGTPVWSSG